MDVFEVPVFALCADSLFGPQTQNHADRLLEALAALRHRHAVDLELLRQESAAEAGVEATLAHVIEHREVAAEVRRMVKRRDHRAGDEADAPGARRHRRQEHAGIRRMPAVIVERVLDRLDRAVAEHVGPLGDAQALLVVVRRGAVLRAEGGEKVKPESHRGCSPATRRASGTPCAAPGLPPYGGARRSASPAAPDYAPRAASWSPRSAPARI